jgi:transposase-like protein
MEISIAGRRLYVWRAVEGEGEVLEILVQPRPDKAAALRLFRILLRIHAFAPAAIVTGKLRSCCAALREICTSKAFAPTIERRTRIRCFDDANERCKSNQPNRLSVFVSIHAGVTIRSMYNATWLAVRRIDSFERRPTVFG